MDYGNAPPKRGTFFRLEVYKTIIIEILQVQAGVSIKFEVGSQFE